MEFEPSRPCGLLTNNFSFVSRDKTVGEGLEGGRERFETIDGLFVLGLVPRSR